MSKTMILAATLLTLGMGAAFAQGNAATDPARTATTSATTATTTGDAHPAASYPVMMHHSVSVYDQFRTEGFAQGGEN